MDRHSGIAASGLPATADKPDGRHWHGLRIWVGVGIAGQLLLAAMAVVLATFAASSRSVPDARLDALLAMTGFGLAVGIVATGCSAFRSGARQDTMALVGSFLGISLLSLAFILLGGGPEATPGLHLSHGTFHSAVSLLAAAGIFVAVRMAAPVPLIGIVPHTLALGVGVAAAAVILGLGLAASAASGGQPGPLAIGAFATLVVILLGFAVGRLFRGFRRQPALDAACLLVGAVAGIVSEVLFLLAASTRPALDAVAHAWDIGMFALLYAAVFYQSARRTYPQPRASLPVAAGNEHRFRSLLEIGSDWYWETDVQHRFTAMQGWNSPVFGAPIEHYIGRHRWDLPIHNMGEQDWIAHRRLLDSHEPFQHLLMKTRDWSGELRWISVDGRPMFDAQGTFLGYCGVGRDVTKLREAEEARDREREMLAYAQKIARLGRWEWAIAEETVRGSEETLRMFGIEPREGLTRADFLQRMHHDDREKVQAAVDAALERDVPYSIVYRVFRDDGTVRTVHSEAQLFRDEAGRPVRMMGTCQDISARVAAEQALRESEARIRTLNIDLERRVEERTRQLAAANKELEAFSYSVSHDLQAPLRRIERYAELLVQTNGNRLDDSGRDMLKRVQTATTHTKRLIEDMLKLSKVTRADVAFSSVDLSAMAGLLLEQLSTHAVPARQVEVLIDPGMSVHADPAMLHILLDNLLGNAWKFTARTEEAWIQVGRPAEGAPGFVVRDNGAGFDMRYAHKLFGAFQRLHGQDEFQGSGIGLAIVQRIVNLHGWRIEAAAEPGKGATFTVHTK